ncbi:MAG: hypothetical protein JNL97_06105 [Verrucomicrobiales bacterium]|nr:hypothetical protein [Verrucomicrobiales bacterium]
MKRIGIYLAVFVGLALAAGAAAGRHDLNPLLGQVPRASVRKSDLFIPSGGFVLNENRLQIQGYYGFLPYGKGICDGWVMNTNTMGEGTMYDTNVNAQVYATRRFRLYQPHENITYWNNFTGKWRWDRGTIKYMFVCYTDRGIVALPEMPQKNTKVQPY